MTIEINEFVVNKLLATVDAGLSAGLGRPVPGHMCVEAAVCYALGMPHSDQPDCVTPALQSLKIRINDAQWSSSEARAKGLRRLAVAQLGSAGVLDDKEFAKQCAILAIRTCVPTALRAAAGLQKGGHRDKLLIAADLCEREPTKENAGLARDAASAASYAASASASASAASYAYAASSYAAYASSYAAYAYAAYSYAYAAASAASYAYAVSASAAKRDEQLAAFCEGVVQILIGMNAPGCKWLFMTEATIP